MEVTSEETAVSQKAPVFEQLSLLGSRISFLGGILDKLRRRLTPILGTEDSETLTEERPAKVIEDTSNKLNEIIIRERIRIDDLSKEIENILKRLEI